MYYKYHGGQIIFIEFEISDASVIWWPLVGNLDACNWVTLRMMPSDEAGG